MPNLAQTLTVADGRALWLFVCFQMYDRLLICVVLVIVCTASTVNAIKCYALNASISQTDVDCSDKESTEIVLLNLRHPDETLESCASMTEKEDPTSGTCRLLTYFLSHFNRVEPGCFRGCAISSSLRVPF